MTTYDKLVLANQNGEIDDLQFLLAQEEIAALYLQDMRTKGETPTPSNAKEWLTNYENNNLYN